MYFGKKKEVRSSSTGVLVILYIYVLCYRDITENTTIKRRLCFLLL